jgi:hypothetical protein
VLDCCRWENNVDVPELQFDVRTMCMTGKVNRIQTTALDQQEMKDSDATLSVAQLQCITFECRGKQNGPGTEFRVDVSYHAFSLSLCLFREDLALSGRFLFSYYFCMQLRFARHLCFIVCDDNNETIRIPPFASDSHL